VKWENIEVGEIIKVENHQEIPADMLLVASSDEQGLAYVETANLDGERNLKLKQSKAEIKDLIRKSGVNCLKGAMLVETPNQKIQSFKGIIEIEGLDSIYLNYNNLLLRGTHLKNTDYVIGIVVYTGHDSKLLKNQGVFRNKRSQLERQLNKYILAIFIIQLFFCLLLMGLSVQFRRDHLDTPHGVELTYLYPTQENFDNSYGAFTSAMINLASFLLLLNTMIPISLMVSLELAKWFQATWLEYDRLLWEGNDKVKVLNMLIHEDLAKVEYIFADKTGTLTANEMKFTYCSINGTVYSKDQLYDCIKGTTSQDSTPQNARSTPTPIDNFSFKQFWLCIGLCHDIVIDSRHKDDTNPRTRYQGSSPDEVELVSTAAEINYKFQDKKAETYVLNVNGEVKEYQILAKIDFSSERKRMSVITRSLQDNKIHLFCKGADSIILKRIRDDVNHDLLDKTHQHLENFSKEGLRTLVTAYKEIDEEYFQKWQERYQNATLEQYNVLTDLDHLAELEKLENEIESGLILLGVTALEDKLQEGVPETIRDLHKAGIKIWMLTGDKLETAENIGYATHLIAPRTKVFKIKTHNVEKTKLEYENIQKDIEKNMKKSEDKYTIFSKEILPEPDEESFNTCALIIDGEAISYTFNNDELKSTFLSLIPSFRTVICCRSTPNQKAEVVTFVKHNLKKITLAIGDGGNDVNMIQKADIGIGLFGKEGNQAAFASDYAIGRFFFLWRLLLVHGRWFYIRTANFINYFFYKNLIFTLPQFWFGLSSAYSGQSYYDDGFITCYNSVFTAVAPVYYAAQEQDVNPRENETIRKAMPYLYAEFRDKKNLFAAKKFFFWWGIGFLHSVIVYYIIQATLQGPVNSSGQTLDLWMQSITAVAGIFFSGFAVIIMGTKLYHIITFVCYGIFTLIIYFPFGSFIIDSLPTPTGELLVDILSTPVCWFARLLIAVICSLILYIPKQYYSFFQPSLIDLLQRNRNQTWDEEQKKGVKKGGNENKLLTSDGKFYFDQRIMLDGWYIPPNTHNPNSARHTTN